MPPRIEPRTGLRRGPGHPEPLRRGDPCRTDLDEVWLDLHWGNALLGLRQPGAVEHLVRAARLADRLSFLLALDLALRLLAIAYAEAGHASQAAILVGYADANLSQYRLDAPGLRWTKPRLEQALAGLADRSHYETEGSTWHRRQIMALINELPSTTD